MEIGNFGGWNEVITVVGRYEIARTREWRFVCNMQTTFFVGS